MTSAAQNEFASYYICARAAKANSGLPQWPKVKCEGCDCNIIKVRLGTLGDEHKENT